MYIPHEVNSVTHRPIHCVPLRWVPVTMLSSTKYLRMSSALDHNRDIVDDRNRSSHSSIFQEQRQVSCNSFSVHYRRGAHVHILECFANRIVSTTL